MKVDEFFIVIFVGHVIQNFVTNSYWLPVMAGAPSVQIPRKYCRSNPERMQAFLTAKNMSSPRVLVASVSMERKSSHNSKLEERQRTKINNCEELLISVDSSTASANKLSFLFIFAYRESFNC